jgi:acetylornithine/succinyldiaminopimelate/putrescine aminotransferase
MKLAELAELESRWLMQTYARAPVEFVRGEGVRLWDSEGREYLDFLAGISVCSVGHCHPAVVAAVREQVAVVMLEPIQGETGVHVVPDEVIAAAREACDGAGALLVFDEIQTGWAERGRCKPTSSFRPAPT